MWLLVDVKASFKVFRLLFLVFSPPLPPFLFLSLSEDRLLFVFTEWLLVLFKQNHALCLQQEWLDTGEAPLSSTVIARVALSRCCSLRIISPRGSRILACLAANSASGHDFLKQCCDTFVIFAPGLLGVPHIWAFTNSNVTVMLTIKLDCEIYLGVLFD